RRGSGWAPGGARPGSSETVMIADTPERRHRSRRARARTRRSVRPGDELRRAVQGGGGERRLPADVGRRVPQLHGHRGGERQGRKAQIRPSPDQADPRLPIDAGYEPNRGYTARRQPVVSVGEPVHRAPARDRGARLPAWCAQFEKWLRRAGSVVDAEGVARPVDGITEGHEVRRGTAGPPPDDRIPPAVGVLGEDDGRLRGRRLAAAGCRRRSAELELAGRRATVAVGEVPVITLLE